MRCLKINVPYNWQPREYQFPFWQAMMNPDRTQRKKRAAVVWHRRAGKDLTSIQICIAKAVERVGLYWHLLPTYQQGRRIVWNGMTASGSRFLDYIPPELVRRKREDQMLVELKNGSIYQVVGTDNIDSLVGSNPVGCVFSEYSLQDPSAWDLISPILKENGGWSVFIYTPRGKNHGYQMIEAARGREDWFSQVLTVDDTEKEATDEYGSTIYDETGRAIMVPVITPKDIQEDREMGIDEETILQEYYCSFDAALKGAYYAKSMQEAMSDGRIGKVNYDQLLPVHTAWDIGVSDYTTVWFFQIIGEDPRVPREIRVIDFLKHSGEGLPYYIKILREEKKYRYGQHLGPHDIKQREFGTGKSVLEIAERLGFKFTVLDRMSVNDGINEVRRIIPLTVFNEVRCDRGIAALKEYSKKWNKDKLVFEDKPMHNWASHAADAFRQLAMGLHKIKVGRNKPTQATANSDYNLLSHKNSNRPTTAQNQYSIYNDR